MIGRGLRISAACGVVALAAFAMLHGVPAYSYLPEGSASGGVFTPDKWTSLPVPVAISSNIASGSKLQGNTRFETVMQNSLATWGAAPNFSDPLGSPVIVNLPGPQTGTNLICFCTSNP